MRALKQNDFYNLLTAVVLAVLAILGVAMVGAV